MRISALLLSALLCAGQIAAPVLGYVRGVAGDLRPVRGVAGAFVRGDAIAEGVLAASFTGNAGLAKTESEILVFRSGEVVERLAAPAGLASFGHTPSGEPAWVRFADDTCLVWRNNRPVEGNCPPPEAIEIPPHLTIPSPPVAIERMGEGWLAVHTAAGIYAVRTESGREALYRLPEAAQ